jgi:hypothetical protein
MSRGISLTACGLTVERIEAVADKLFILARLIISVVWRTCHRRDGR